MSGSDVCLSLPNDFGMLCNFSFRARHDVPAKGAAVNSPLVIGAEVWERGAFYSPG